MKATGVTRVVLVFSLLAFILLFISAMNYVLITIASLANRVMSISVHKCNGASNRNIFTMLLSETVFFVLIASLFSVLLICAFRQPIEGIIQTPLASVFSLNNLWGSLITILGLILLSGIIPASIFSSLSPTYLFQTYSVNKKYWKMALLFVQFAGVSFAGALLTVIVLQYHLLLNKDLGYVTENVYYTENTNSISDETFALLKNELLQRPEISNVSITSNLPMDFLTGFEIFDDKNGESLFSSRGMAADKDFFETMQMEMLSGQYFTESKFNYSEAVVNEEFVKMMGITGAAVGQTFVTKLDDVLSVKIIGVVKNFNIFTLYKQSSMQDIPPLIIFSREEARRDWWHPFNRLVVRTHSANSELYAQLNIHIRKMFNSNIVYFEPYRMKIEQMYDATLVYRNTVWAAVAVLCIITILGLFGYLHNETIRRRQEILIRRIHGATIVNILYLFSKYIIGIFIPAILTGFIIAYFIGIKWLESFSVKISLNVSLFFTVGIFLLAGIFVCISLQIADIMRKNVSQFLTK